MEEDKKVKDVLVQLEREFGKGAVMRLGEHRAIEGIESVSTGVLSLDLALGIGGVPKGRITEIFGQEASGKTTLALTILANVQKKGGVAAFIDAEHALDPTYAKRIGVDVDNLLIAQPDTGENALEIAEALIRTQQVEVVVIDSVAALVPKAELEGEMGEAHIGLQARLMSQALRKLTAIIHKSNAVTIFINQLRERVGPGAMFGPPEVTPGGRALKFYASIRMDMRKVHSITRGEKTVGNRVKVNVVKNKLAPPFRQAEFDIYYGEGICWESSVLDVAVNYNLITRSGSWFSYKDTKLGQGRDAALQYLKEHPQITQELFTQIKQSTLSSGL